MNSKKPEGKNTPKRTSRRLAEIARQEMLRARRAANGGHEVGDTPSDPLILISEDEEIEPAKPIERSLNEHPHSINTRNRFPPGEIIYFTSSDLDPSSEASRGSSSYNKTESSTAFSTNRKK
nr:uncharacterized protein LOC109166971 [Ipomoea batatas]